MKNAVITGGTGYIAKNLAIYLASKNIKVYVISRNAELSFQDENILVINFDLMNDKIEWIKDISEPIHALFHLAWIGCESRERDDMSLQAENIKLAMNVVRLAKYVHCNKVIFPGSPLEYQDGNDMICETSIPAPHNSYGAVKIASHYIMETLCKQNKINFVYVMVSSIYGPGRNQGVISYAITSLLKGESPKFTSLEQYWDYVYIDDVVNGLYLIGFRGGTNAFTVLVQETI